MQSKDGTTYITIVGRCWISRDSRAIRLFKMPRSHAKLVYINSCFDRLLFLILLFSIQFNLNLPYNLRAVKAKTLNFSRRYILQRSLMWSPQIIIFEELCNHVAFVWSRQECWVMHTVGSEQCVQSSLTYAFRANKSRSRVSDKLLCMYINWVSVHNQNLNGTRVFYMYVLITQPFTSRQQIAPY